MVPECHDLRQIQDCEDLFVKLFRVFHLRGKCILSLDDDKLRKLSRLFGSWVSKKSSLASPARVLVRNTGPHLRMSTGSAWYVQD